MIPPREAVTLETQEFDHAGAAGGLDHLLGDGLDQRRRLGEQLVEDQHLARLTCQLELRHEIARRGDVEYLITGHEAFSCSCATQIHANRSRIW
jgi:hypothetical protein